MAHERITRMIAERYRAHSSECRRIWRLKDDGPQLHVDVTDEDEAEFSLRGRSRTLANRQFKWKHDGGDGTMAELLGATGSGKPLDAQLANVAMVQAVRAAVAADMGTGAASLPADRILIDRFVASTLMAKNDAGILGRIARAARKADGDEIMPNSQMTMTNAGSLQFGVSPVEVDLPDDKVRPPQVRMTSVTLARTVTYIHSRLQIDGGTIPRDAGDRRHRKAAPRCHRHRERHAREPDDRGSDEGRRDHHHPIGGGHGRDTGHPRSQVRIAKKKGKPCTCQSRIVSRFEIDQFAC